MMTIVKHRNPIKDIRIYKNGTYDHGKPNKVMLPYQAQNGLVRINRCLHCIAGVVPVQTIEHYTQ